MRLQLLAVLILMNVFQSHVIWLPLVKTSLEALNVFAQKAGVAMALQVAFDLVNVQEVMLTVHRILFVEEMKTGTWNALTHVKTILVVPTAIVVLSVIRSLVVVLKTLAILK